MQRLKQINSGAVLPLGEDELLLASTTCTNPGGPWYQIRMRVQRDGYAERAVHLNCDGDTGGFSHQHIRVMPESLRAIENALEAARAEAMLLPETEEDPNALFRTFRFWHDGERSGVAAEYRHNRPRYPSPQFEAAWRLVAEQFQNVGVVQAAMPDIE